MKKAVIGTLVMAFILSGTQAFAQFKLSPKSAKNLANLDRVIARATKKPSLLDRVLGYKNPGPVKLPSGVVVPGNAGLQAVKMPKTVTPANQSYFNWVHAMYNGYGWSPSYQTVESYTRIAFEDWIKISTHNSFYTQQEQLAQDLDAFYHGIADVFIGPDSRKVKLYALPADGILYNPEGYSTPLVLNSDEYFVIYDVLSKTGKIAENKSEVYNLFKHPPEEKIYGKFNFFKGTSGVEIWRPIDPVQYYKWNRDDVSNKEQRIKDWEKEGYPEQFASEYDLCEILYRRYGYDVPHVHQPNVGWYNVYELPKPVVIAQPGVAPMEVNPDDYVVIHRRDWFGPAALGSVKLIKRQDVENLFKLSK